MHVHTHTLLHAYFNILVSLLSYLEDHKLVLSDQRFVHDVVFLCSNNNNNNNQYSHLLSYFSGLELSKLAVNSSIFCDCKKINANADLNTDIDSSTLILINVIN